VPWTEFEGNPETGKERFLHVGAKAFPITTDGYLREIAVWRTGVVWFENTGLRFLGWDGSVVKVKGVPAWYGRLVYGASKLYFVKGPVVMSLSADDLTPKREFHAADIAGLDRDDPTLRASVVGLLDVDDPVLRLSSKLGNKKFTSLYSAKQGLLPLSAQWRYLYSPSAGVIVGSDADRRIWAAYDSGNFRPLWTHSFVDAERHLRISERTLTPSGRHLVVSVGHSDTHVLILDVRTGRVEKRVRLPLFDVYFEDDTHFVYPTYDGPPNPFYDPRDTFPEPSELEWPNVLVRCSLEGACERAARVDAPEQSLLTGTTHLFPRRG